MNNILQQAIDAVIGKGPGIGLGQTLKSATMIPSIEKNQDKQSEDMRTAIGKILLNTNRNDSQTYKDIQNQYQGLANEQMQSANDTQDIRNNGLTSLGLSAGALSAPTVLPAVATAIERSKIFTPVGQMYSGKKLPMIISQLLGK